MFPLLSPECGCQTAILKVYCQVTWSSSTAADQGFIQGSGQPHPSQSISSATHAESTVL